MPLLRLFLVLSAWLPALVLAGGEKPEAAYGWQQFSGDVGLIGRDAALTVGGISLVGFTRWNWGSSHFHDYEEGWFGENTRSGGIDKLGHAFSAYTMTNAMAERMVSEGADPESAALSAALLAQGITFYIEVFDGLSQDHGFSYEDAVLNAAGGGLAWLRQRYPAVREVVDYRLEYDPSGYDGFDLLGDYSGQKYLLAFKLAGIEPCLPWLELQVGYYATGFSSTEIDHGERQRRYAFVGLGLDFSRIFFGERRRGEGLGKRTGRFFFEHIQLPATSVRAKNAL